MQTQWICGRCLSSILRRHKNGRFLPAAIRRYAQSTHPIPEDHAIKTRNIGIIAHIDAGKTTTTERMLYYSGFTRRLGDVDEGSTVTDFLPAERARGITIQSAAISFMWPPVSPDATTPSNGPNTLRSSTPHNINLIDTPGHADFTFEVLRSLRVLDGAVCILDGVAGVEAQTDKVWAQAAAHQIPRIIFINKLDRDGAAFGRTIKEIAARLAVWPAVCGIPWWSEDGKLNGIGDVINLRGLRYPSGGDGKQIDLFDWTRLQAEAPILAAELKKARIALIELLSEHDDRMVEHYLDADEDHTAISSNDIVDSLRRCVMTSPQMLVPVFAGASFRNIGVQPLLDAVVDLLPSPTERPDPEISLGSQTRASLSRFLKGEVNIGKDVATHPSKSLSKSRASLALKPIESCALAFKVVADAKRGVLVYVRVYSGVINRMAPIWNTNLQTAERAQRLMKMYANDAVDIDAIPAGQIGVIPGLKLTRTGDTLVAYGGGNLKHGPPSPVNQMQLRPIDVPPPVFFVSVEPNSTSEEKHIKESLGLLLREDPSLHVSIDEESGQTHLAGMGELHLEIARDRLVQDLKAKARIGKIEIGYRETLVDNSSEVTELFERNIGGKASKAACTAKVSPIEEGVRSGEDSDHNFELPDNNRLSIFTRGLDSDGSSTTPDGPSLPDHLDLPAVLLALQNGTNAALARGPVHGYPMHSTNIRLIFDIEQHMFPSTTASSLASAARRAVSGALKDSVTMQPSIMMEPVMQVTISVDEDSLGAVVHDISSARGGNVVRLDAEEETSSSRMALTPAHIERIYAPPDPFAGGIAANSLAKSAAGGNMRQIIARVPLKEMVGYLKHLRSLTAGRGTFTMVIDQFERMTSQRQKIVLNELRGDFD